MRYKKLSNDELNRFRYPNLMAELIESGYSICTLGEHMGIGKEKRGVYRKEDDPEIWAKLKGTMKISLNEAIGLARLFNVKMEYLFSHKLNVMCDMPIAYWRWFDENKRREKELQEFEDIEFIRLKLKNKPQVTKLMKKILTMSDEKLQELIECLATSTTNNS